jgi:D-beta-D-heptose 7-phosphate kinase/D-beta-D-heptose 1-phosphate adenosyltransferase
MKDKNKKQVVVAVSGGFDPVHIGHVRLFQAARKLGDKLVVILNNDNWLEKKKSRIFMRQDERKGIIEAVKGVDEVVLTGHGPNPEDVSVSKELMEIKPDIFANGGDRKIENIPEVATCEAIGCEMVFNVGRGGKVQSSSDLARKIKEK